MSTPMSPGRNEDMGTENADMGPEKADMGILRFEKADMGLLKKRTWYMERTKQHVMNVVFRLNALRACVSSPE